MITFLLRHSLAICDDKHRQQAQTHNHNPANLCIRYSRCPKRHHLQKAAANNLKPLPNHNNQPKYPPSERVFNKNHQQFAQHEHQSSLNTEEIKNIFFLNTEAGSKHIGFDIPR